MSNSELTYGGVFEIDQIIGKKIFRGEGVKYKVKWKDLNGGDTWEKASNIEDKKIIADFELREQMEEASDMELDMKENDQISVNFSTPKPPAEAEEDADLAFARKLQQELDAEVADQEEADRLLAEKLAAEWQTPIVKEKPKEKPKEKLKEKPKPPELAKTQAFLKRKSPFDLKKKEPALKKQLLKSAAKSLAVPNKSTPPKVPPPSRFPSPHVVPKVSTLQSKFAKKVPEKPKLVKKTATVPVPSYLQNTKNIEKKERNDTLQEISDRLDMLSKNKNCIFIDSDSDSESDEPNPFLDVFSRVLQGDSSDSSDDDMNNFNIMRSLMPHFSGMPSSSPIKDADPNARYDWTFKSILQRAGVIANADKYEPKKVPIICFPTRCFEKNLIKKAFGETYDIGSIDKNHPLAAAVHCSTDLETVLLAFHRKSISGTINIRDWKVGDSKTFAKFDIPSTPKKQYETCVVVTLDIYFTSAFGEHSSTFIRNFMPETPVLKTKQGDITGERLNAASYKKGTKDKFLVLFEESQKSKHRELHKSELNQLKTLGLKVDLRPYQKQTVAWMLDKEKADFVAKAYYTKFYYEDGTPYWISKTDFEFLDKIPNTRGGFLGEEMGLGKTIETFAVCLLHGWKDTPHLDYVVDEDDLYDPYNSPQKPKGGTLIITAVSLLQQWVLELQKHIETEKVPKHYLYHGSSRKSDPKFLSQFDVVFTTYSIMADCKLHEVEWNRICLDECHSIKGGGVTSRSCVGLPSVNRWLISGTPITTNFKDIVHQFKFLGIPPLSKPPFWLKNSIAHSKYEFGKHMIRHVKNSKYKGTDLINLPKRHLQIVKVKAGAKEKQLYDYLFNKIRDQIKAAGGPHRVSFGIAMGCVLNLRQICTHPSLVNFTKFIQEVIFPARDPFVDGMNNAKGKEKDVQIKDIAAVAEALKKKDESREAFITEVIEGIKSGEAEVDCPICLDTMTTITFTPCCHVFCKECIVTQANTRGNCPLCRKKITVDGLVQLGTLEDISGGVEQIESLPEDSDIKKLYKIVTSSLTAKFKALIHELNKMEEEDPTAKAVVFTQWPSMVTRIVEELKKQGKSCVSIIGSTTQKKRASQLVQFQSDPNCKFFVISLRSGAVGLTLTDANHVFLVDVSMNAATDEQAVSRCHRIGQTKEVYIKKLVLQDTVEEILLGLQGSGMNVGRDNASVNNSGISDMTSETSNGRLLLDRIFA